MLLRWAQGVPVRVLMVQPQGVILFSVPSLQPAAVAEDGFVVRVCVRAALMAVPAVPAVVAQVEMHPVELETLLPQHHHKVEMVAVVLVTERAGKVVVVARLRLVQPAPAFAPVMVVMVLLQTSPEVVLPTQGVVAVQCHAWQAVVIRDMVEPVEGVTVAMVGRVALLPVEMERQTLGAAQGVVHLVVLVVQAW